MQVVRDILDLEARLCKLLEREVEERAVVRLEVEFAWLLEQAAVSFLLSVKALKL